jgi:hypothetical protein
MGIFSLVFEIVWMICCMSKRGVSFSSTSFTSRYPNPQKTSWAGIAFLASFPSAAGNSVESKEDFILLTACRA